jgi:hypothetical protein
LTLARQNERDLRELAEVHLGRAFAGVRADEHEFIVKQPAAFRPPGVGP